MGENSSNTLLAGLGVAQNLGGSVPSSLITPWSGPSCHLQQNHGELGSSGEVGAFLGCRAVRPGAGNRANGCGSNEEPHTKKWPWFGTAWHGSAWHQQSRVPPALCGGHMGRSRAVPASIGGVQPAAQLRQVLRFAPQQQAPFSPTAPHEHRQEPSKAFR